MHAHKSALAAQRSLWRMLLKERVQWASLVRALGAIKSAEAHAKQVYHRVMER